MGRAEEIFQKFKLYGADVITAMMEAFESESLWLDFKRSSNDGKGTKLGENDRANLARAISGFGNSQGGVVVWGVECRRDKSGADVPTNKRLIQRPTRFVSWLEDAVGACTIPPHPHVEHIALPDPESTDDVGYVATYISESEYAPHQTIQSPDSLKYLMRTGSRFSPVPHAVLAGLFGRRPQPVVTAHWLVHAGTSRDAEGKIDFEGDISAAVAVHIVNEGRTIVREAYATIAIDLPGPKCDVLFDSRDSPWVERRKLRDPRGGTGDERQLTAVVVPAFRLTPQTSVLMLEFDLTLRPPFESCFSYELMVGADGAQPRIEHKSVPDIRLAEIWDFQAPGNAEEDAALSEKLASDLFGSNRKYLPLVGRSRFVR